MNGLPAQLAGHNTPLPGHLPRAEQHAQQEPQASPITILAVALVSCIIALLVITFFGYAFGLF
jgi:hypothetical protein